MAGCDGLLAHGLVTALAGPNTKFALHADYRAGIDSLAELARAHSAEAITVADVAPSVEAPPLRAAARGCVDQLGRIDAALHADLTDTESFPRSLNEDFSLTWWTDLWAEFGTLAGMVSGVAPVMRTAGGGRLILLVPERPAPPSPFLNAAAIALETLSAGIAPELEASQVKTLTVRVPAVVFPGDWKPFQETPLNLSGVVKQVVDEANR